MAYPTSIPSNTDPTASNKLSSPSHSQLHQSHNAEIVAVETKVGTGASTPTSGKVLRATGTGTSAWGQTVLSTDIATATSADLRGVLSDETGTGVAVFATSPTITTPTITTGGSWAGSPTITTPSIVTSINDTNGNEVIKTPATSSAVNEITVTNAATGVSPNISATGGDTNIYLDTKGKGNAGVLSQHPQQANTTNSYPTGLIMQHGWGFMLGTGATSAVKVVTFPVAFSVKPYVVVSTAGFKSGSDPTDQGDTGGSAGGTTACDGVTTSTINVAYNQSGTFTSTIRILYTWIAIGVK